MDPINILPECEIQPNGIISEQFLRQQITTFQQACTWTKALAYGSNSNNENSLILFTEERGTCTTKHGAIARLAQEQGLPVFKTLGFYRLNDEIVSGVDDVLKPYGLDFIPQIHCFLSYQTHRVDLTEGNCNGKNKTITDYDFTIQVQPDLTHAQEEAYYLTHLQQYGAIAPQLEAVGVEAILKLLSICNQQVKYQCSLMATQQIVEPLQESLWWVKPHLLGGMRKPSPAEIPQLHSLGVAAIISVMDDPSNLDLYAQHQLPHLWLPTTGGKAPTPAQVEQLVNFVDQQHQQNHSVVVHCSSGRRRTGTLLAAYLVHSGLSTERAIATVTAANPQVELRDAQIQFLHDLEAQ